LKFYFSEFIGAGTDQDPFIPAAWDSAPLSYHDGREYPEIEDGWCVCWGNPNAVQHANLLADARVTYLPFEDSGGLDVDLDSPISDVTAANRATIVAELESRHIPSNGFTATDTVRHVVKTLDRRIRVREILLYVDFGRQLLSGTVGDIPALQRKALKRRLTNAGYDLSGITNNAR